MTELKTDLEDTGMSKYLVEPALPIPFASNYSTMFCVFTKFMRRFYSCPVE